MRILHIISGLGQGGAERMLVSLAQQHAGQHQITVISLGDRGYYASALESMGVSVHAMGISPTALRWRDFWSLRQRIKTSQPDVVQTWLYHADLLGGVAARLAGIKTIIWSIHNSNLAPDRTKRSTRWVAKACALLSRFVPAIVISCSVAGQKFHQRLGYAARQFVVIPNGFDTAFWCRHVESREALRLTLGLRDQTIIGVIARWDPQKNHLGFLDAASLVHAERPDVHFVFVGQGLDTNNRVFVDAVQAHQLHGVTHLRGSQSNIRDWMSCIDILASPSLAEAFPMVLGEAMSCKTPCVATDTGDSRLIVGGTGFIVPKLSPVAMSAALIRMIDMPIAERAALGEAARRRIQENFEMKAIGKLYLAMYEDTCASTNVPH